MCRMLLVAVYLAATLVAAPLRGQNGVPQQLTITIPVPIDRATGEHARQALAKSIASVPHHDPARPRVLAGEIVLPRVPAELIDIQGLESPWGTISSNDGGRVLDRDALTAVIQANGGPAQVDPDDVVTADEVMLELGKQIAEGTETEGALLMLMCLHMKVDRLEAALTDLDRLVAKAPQRIEYLVIRSQLQLRFDNVAAAERDLNRAVQLRPQSIYAHAARCQLLASRRDYEQAMLDIDACLTIDPKCHEALTYRAQIRFNLNRYQAALDDCNEALRLAPKSVQALAARGRVHACLEKLDEALADYNAAIAASPEPSSGLLSARAIVLFGAKKYDEALRDTTEAVRLGPATGRLLLLRAEIKKLGNDQAGARADLLEAVRVADTDVRQTVYLANSLSECKEQAAAKRAYERAASLPASDTEELADRAEARYFTDKTVLAIEDCSAAIALDPQHARCRHLRTMCYVSLEEWNKAREDVTELIRDNANCALYYKLRAQCWYAKGQIESSLADYTKAIELDPNDAQSRIIRGTMRHGLKQYSKAIDDYAAAIRLDENCVDAYRRLAQIWSTCPDKDYRQGEAAVGAASRLIAGPHPQPIDYALLASAYAECGKFDEAIKHQEQALHLNPADPQFQASEKARLELYRAGKPYHESASGTTTAP